MMETSGLNKKKSHRPTKFDIFMNDLTAKLLVIMALQFKQDASGVSPTKYQVAR